MSQSNQHSSRIDEQLANEKSSAAVQSADWQQGTSEGLTPIEVDLRSELASYLEGLNFPVERVQILENIQSTTAPQAVINLVEQLPSDTLFENMQQIWDSIS